jgi:hypothetical protein
MRKIRLRSAVSFIIVLLAFISVNAQERTVGLFLNDSSSFNGYTLFAPLAYINTYLINNDGLLVNLWEGSYRPGLSAYLLENGNLLRTAFISNSRFVGGGSGGLIQEFDWDGNMLWEFEYSTDQFYQHHDVERLPNGNTLIIAWEYKSFDDATTAGRNPNLMSQNELWPDHIIEVQPDGATGGNIVWEWHVWDHLIQDYNPLELNYGVVSEHPELIDINFISNLPNSLGADWTHINAVDYNEEFDQIILSVHHFGEIWVIDHSTTTEEAAGHTGGNSGMGGDLLYRWGNPQTYDRGDASDQMLFGQHDAHWIESGRPGEGNILIFNNGRNRPGGQYSTVDEIVPPVDQSGNYLLNADSTYGPDELVWTYVDPIPSEFFSPNVSGSQRQPNGNTLICSGTWGRFFEVTNEGELVWLYVNPVIATGPMYYENPIPGSQNWTFRVYRYAEDYPGFEGRDLTPGDPIELYPASIVEINTDLIPKQFELFQNYPNPFNPSTKIEYSLPADEFVNLTVYDVLGNTITTLVNEKKQTGSYEVIFDASDLSSGVFFYKLTAGEYVNIKKMVVIR